MAPPRRPAEVRLPPGVGPGKRSRWLRAGLLLVTLLAWSPLLSVFLAAVAAGALGCRLDEGSVHPCPAPLGSDLGSLLYAMGMMGWLMLGTLPFMALTALAWLVLALRWAWRRLRR